jgi:hypothetical protein
MLKITLVKIIGERMPQNFIHLLRDIIAIAGCVHDDAGREIDGELDFKDPVR